MIFIETKLNGAFLIKPFVNEDERGFFSRTFCKKEFETHGLNGNVVQCNLSYNSRRGTFRGMHFQVSPFEEDKTVACIQGSVLDYIVDLRESSPTFREWISVELTGQNGYSLYVPKGFAHGFLTLEDDTLIHYRMSQYYHPEAARGFRYDDPAFNISLPFEITTISERDREFSDVCVPSIN